MYRPCQACIVLEAHIQSAARGEGGGMQCVRTPVKLHDIFFEDLIQGVMSKG